MAKYFVVWSGDDGPYVIQTEIETDQDPYSLSDKDWITLAAMSEDYEIEDGEVCNLYCVIDSPTHFYN